MVSMKILRRAGFTPERLKKLFEPGKSGYTPNIKRLLEVISSRLINGRTMNLNNFRSFWAADCAYNAPFNQTSIALVQQFFNKTSGCSMAEAERMCGEWGLNAENIFYPETDKNGNVVLGPGNKPQMRIRAQNFFQVLIPIVKSYITVRQAKLFNDRNLSPLFKFEPISFTAEKRALCEVVTDLIERMSMDFGFPSYLKQVILQTLLYGFCLAFVKEPWFKQVQLAEKEKYTVQDGDSLRSVADRFNITIRQLQKENPKRKGKAVVGEELTIPERETCAKQGLRYDTPHPTRCFFDLSEPTNTINTDTGVVFAGYWDVKKYGDLMSDPDLWNKEAVPFGTNDWFNWNGARAFWSEVFPCQMQFPKDAWIGPGDSMQRQGRLLYNIQNDIDAPVFVTSLVMKIVPSQYGLADYDYPVWVRFMVANDSTVLWADAVPYCPILYCAYDADNNRWPNASMALEILPFQVQLGNILSQILFTAKQALWKIVPYDTNQIDEATIKTLQNKGDPTGGAVFLPYDSMKSKVATATGPKDMFQPLNLGLASSVEMTNQISVIIDILERLLGMSSQEVGTTATHEQSATETRVISENTTVRVDFTGSFVDDFIKAWKEQCYYAAMAFMDDEFISQVLPTPETLAALDKLGFDVPDNVIQNSYTSEKVQIRVQKQKLVLDGFASDRDGANRINDPQIAAVILQGVQAIVQNPLLAQSVGAPALLDIMTNAMILAGAPKDFRLRVDPKAGPDAQAQMIQQQVQAMGQQIMKDVIGQVGEGIKPLAEAIKQGQQQEQQLGRIVPELAQKIAQLSQALQANGQMDQQIGQAVVKTKQEADATAQAVLQIKQMIEAMVQHINPGAMPPMGAPPMAAAA